MLNRQRAASAALNYQSGRPNAPDDWPLEDPKGKPIVRVREIRDDVQARVIALLLRERWALG